MFHNATAFDQPIGGWNTQSVTDMGGMFMGAISFNQPIGNWDTQNVQFMQNMFEGATSFNQPLNWNTINVTTMKEMFMNATSFNQPLNFTSTQNVQYMYSMFMNATSFNQDISTWNTQNVQDMHRMFHNAIAFNQPIGSWNTINVQNMDMMFLNATAFNQPIGSWNTISVQSMHRMFNNATSFNQDISTWNTQNVQDMHRMFHNAIAFDQPIGGWNTQSVTDMGGMFMGAISFNQPIGNWDTQNVQFMQNMFEGATSFNQPLNWNTINVTTMKEMFMGATAFDQDLSTWNTGNVQLMYNMFLGATSFNQNLGSWDISNVIDMSNMLDNSGIDISNYDSTLIGWSAQSVKPNVPLGAAGRQFCNSATQRAILINAPNNWNISGDSDACPPIITNVTSTTSDGIYGPSSNISIQVVFSEIVNVTGTPTLTLNSGGTATYSSGSGTNTLTFTYTVAPGHSSPDLDYTSTTALSGGSIKDSVNLTNAVLTLPNPGGSGSLGNNKNIVIDGIQPTVTNVTSSTADGIYGIGSNISIQVVFNEVVTVTGTPTLSLNSGGTATYSSGSGTNTLTFTYTVSSGENSNDLDYTSTSALSGGTIQDLALNNAILTLPNPGSPGSLGDNKNIVIDTTAPTVVNITSSNSDGTYGIGSNISIQVVFSEPVNVSGTPNLTLNSGGTASYSSGSGTNTLVFTYTVAPGENSSDLDYTSTSALSGGTIQDLALNNAILTLPNPGSPGSLGDNKNIVIDGIQPTVTNVTSSTADGIYGIGSNISIQVVFSEPVNVSGSPTLTLNSGGTASYSSGSGTNTLVFTYTVAPGENSSDLDYTSTSALSGGTIQDLALNNAILTLPNPGSPGSLGDNKNIVIDGIQPTVTNVTSSTADGVYGIGSNISIQVTFSEPVNVSGTPTLTLNSGGTATYSSGSGTNTLTFTYTVASGENSSDLDYTSPSALSGGTIQDLALNNAILTLPNPGAPGSLGDNKNIVVDTTAPTVVNITSSNSDGNYGIGSNISIQVVFSEPVNVSGTPTLSLNSGGTATYSSGSGTNTLIFTYTALSGHNSIDLDYTSTSALSLSGGSIVDLALNNAILTLPTPGAPGSLGNNKNIVIDTDLIPSLVMFGNPPATNSGGSIFVNPNTPFTVTISQTTIGNPNFSYSFSGICSGSTTNSPATGFVSNILNLPSGTYTCTGSVTDADNDVATVSITINVVSNTPTPTLSPTPTITITPSLTPINTVTISPTPNNSTVNISLSANGIPIPSGQLIKITDLDNPGNYFFVVVGSNSQVNLNNIPDGKYSIEYKSSDGNTYLNTVDISNSNGSTVLSLSVDLLSKSNDLSVNQQNNNLKTVPPILDLTNLVSLLEDLNIAALVESLPSIFLLVTVLIFALISNLPFILGNTLLALLGRKRDGIWGIVIDFDSKKPIPLATARIYNSGTTYFITQTTTDLDGRFGFMLEDGNYRLEIAKDNFWKYVKDIQVKDKKPINLEQEIYLYNIQSHQNVVNSNISIDTSLLKYRISKFLKSIANLLLILGTVVSILVVFIYPTLINLLILTIYISTLFIRKYVDNKLNRYMPSSILDSSTGYKIPLATIKVYDLNLNLVDIKKSGMNGCFDFNVTPGWYYLEVIAIGYTFPSKYKNTYEVYNNLLKVYLHNGNNKLDIYLDPVTNYQSNSSNFANPFGG